MAKQQELFELFQPSTRKTRARKNARRGPRQRTHGQAQDSARAANTPAPRKARSRRVRKSEPAEVVKAEPAPVVVPMDEEAPAEVLPSEPAAPNKQGLRRLARQLPRTITLRFEEAAVYGIVSVVLVVLSFLLGRYGAAEAPTPQAAQIKARTERVAATPVTRGKTDPLAVRHHVALRSLADERAAASPTQAQSAPAAPSADRPYCIWVVKYRRSQKTLAKIARERLESKGIKPVRLHSDRGGIWVLAGAYTAPDAAEAQQALGNVTPAFRSAEIHNAP
jgi:hypothetical protein